MSDIKKVWIDPNDCGLVTVEAAEQKRRQEAERQRRKEIERQQREARRQRRLEAEQKCRKEQAMKQEEEEKKNAARTQALTTQPKPEILPPASKVPALPLDASMTTSLDLAEFECQIRYAADMLDLGKPEGWLDRLFGRPDHRIDVKTERGLRLAAYIAACTAIVQAAGSLQDVRRQAYLNQLIFLRQVAEQNYKLELTRRQVERQDTIEDAKAREIVALHEANIRKAELEGRPSLPPPPAPKTEDPRVKKKAGLKQELDRLVNEEKNDLAKISGGKPQGEWTDEMDEEIKRTINMYAHTKEKVRDELRKYL